MTREDLEKGLHKYIPAASVRILADHIVTLNVHLKITKSRSTKFGDYRPPFRGAGHRISINHNLNPQAFLVTLVHEIAHLVNWKKNQDRVQPHGREWKYEFRLLMEPLLRPENFEEHMIRALSSYLKNPAASSCADPQLYKALHHHGQDDGLILLEELPENAVFLLDEKMLLRKGKKMRTRYLCQEINTKRMYYVSGVARVEFTSPPGPLSRGEGE